MSASRSTVLPSSGWRRGKEVEVVGEREAVVAAEGEVVAALVVEDPRGMHFKQQEDPICHHLSFRGCFLFVPPT
jgi:hypothetical protein